MSVSYTHLDVYKRQALRDAMEANLASIDAELQRIEARNGGDGGRLDMLRTQLSLIHI